MLYILPMNYAVTHMLLLTLWYTLCIRVARFLVHKYPPALTDEDENGNTPLHLAALNGRTEMVDFLIQEGAEVEAK